MLIFFQSISDSRKNTFLLKLPLSLWMKTHYLEHVMCVSGNTLTHPEYWSRVQFSEVGVSLWEPNQTGDTQVHPVGPL